MEQLSGAVQDPRDCACVLYITESIMVGNSKLLEQPIVSIWRRRLEHRPKFPGQQRAAEFGTSLWHVLWNVCRTKSQLITMTARYIIPGDIDLKMKRLIFRSQFSVKLNSFNVQLKKYCPLTSCLTADIFRLFEHRVDILFCVSRSFLDNNFFMIADMLAPNIIVKEEPWHTNKPHVRISIGEKELKLPGLV